MILCKGNINCSNANKCLRNVMLFAYPFGIPEFVRYLVVSVFNLSNCISSRLCYPLENDVGSSVLSIVLKAVFI